ARVLRPAAGVDFRLHWQPARIERLCEQQASGTVLVGAIAVAGLAGDERDLLDLRPGRSVLRLGPGRDVPALFGDEPFQADVAELHLHRRPGVQLQGEDSLLATRI